MRRLNEGLLSIGSLAPQAIRFERRHPEWWCWALVVSAWVFMLPHMTATGGAGSAGCSCCSGTLPQWSQRWVAMLAAMMLPLHIARIRFVAYSNLVPRRNAAIALYLCGAGAPWLAVAVPLYRVHRWLEPRALAVAAMLFLASAVWCRTEWCRRAWASCGGGRATAIRGPKWLADQLQEGSRHGTACLITCLPSMLACALTGHGAFAMVGGAYAGLLARIGSSATTSRLVVLQLALAGWYGLRSLKLFVL